MLTRRSFLASCGAAAVLPGLTLAKAPTDRRLAVIVLRGGMDGLAAVVPLGDPDHKTARGALALSGEAVRPLDTFFALHGALEPLLPYYKKGQVLAVHAVASPYRERSHFDGQDVLEGGGARPHALNDGWLNRALKLLGPVPAMAFGQGVPLALRGEAAVSSWAPAALPGLSPDTIRRLATLYKEDRLLAHALEEGVQMEAFVDDVLGGDMERGMSGGRDFAKLADAAGRLMASEEGPRVAVLDLGGWDTHTGQGGRMAQPLSRLAAGIVALAEALGPAWSRTVVVAASEFGRTVAANGTNGTDHGTAGAVLLAGGAVKGGRVVADWPGLAKAKLHQGRDLRPTADLRSVFKGILHGHLGIDRKRLDGIVFPDSAGAKALDGLVRA
jgi:uncharacterized protein (DUF1501 family)